ncbi:MAG: TatD family hydrolase [Pseudoalteromonas spongiae]|uniref:YchF/TatD family DNA exonuclease n=1 Tax=Pseudoalteromonas spongiae TaxID=298657 RepID=A0ABU8ERU0_9GAMM|nr:MULTISPECIES: YchF/TatD family DNA exonuclease [Pseudoalteromonas]ATC98834.1 TatD DNase family protein [Pseudoalteromonas spongiae UST010723-006]KPV94217.1 putative deoxyribonuclease YcfH [Pseudoalteromonas sp. P1-9]MCF6456120.1 YchF/TatD family DNA exonuclease [Pseudoalteromonas sp. MMG024]TMO83303.1 YchF/TatD family DNA exonuclease [Pseudoalteromonas spongiae]
MIVDSHCHLDRLNFDELGLSLDQVLENARAKSVEHFLCVSVTLDQFPSMLEKVKAYPDVSVSCGVHPLDQKDVLDKARLVELATHDKVVAIGETGLDYYYSKDTHQVQQDSFAGHIDVANELNKPLIIHTRDAKQDTLDIMRAHNAQNCGGVLHCFTEDWEMAKQALDLGFYISISGIVTFRNAAALREVVEKIPLDRLLIETDSPYLAPVPHRGKTNQPAYVEDVAYFIADLKKLSFKELAKATTDNFYDLFKLAK